MLFAISPFRIILLSCASGACVQAIIQFDRAAGKLLSHCNGAEILYVLSQNLERRGLVDKPIVKIDGGGAVLAIS